MADYDRIGKISNTTSLCLVLPSISDFDLVTQVMSDEALYGCLRATLCENDGG